MHVFERNRRTRTLLLVALLLGSGAVAAASVEAGRVVFLLGYVGTDYPNAVRDGEVLDPAEYGEVLRFTRLVLQEVEAAGAGSGPLVGGLRTLEEKIERRAPAEEIAALTRELVPALSATLGVSSRPPGIPNLGNGAFLWRRDCAACHGAAGGGDGFAALHQVPKPTELTGDLLDRLSPRQIHGAVGFGVEGTGMPSFAGAYTDEETWDVAFFVMTLRAGFEPKQPIGTPDIDLEALAASSNRELLARMRRSRPDATAGEVDYLRLHLARTEPAGSGGVAVALQMQEAFAGVADRVLPAVVGVSSYVADAGDAAVRDRSEGWSSVAADALRHPGFELSRTGSGFFLGEEGYFLSCDHLVRDEHGQIAPLVDVELQDNTLLRATVVGTEPTLDLAVLRVADAQRVPEAARKLRPGDSQDVRVGSWLVAVGDPPGPEKTFVVGVVAAPPAQQCYQDQLSATLLQSSLVVPERGAGGPVVDILGRVLGIVVGRGPGTRVLPVNLALNLFEALKVARSERSPWIGISVLELPLARRRLAAQRRTTAFPRSGVYVDDVFSPSPAQLAGVRAGDFLVGMDGHAIASVADFQKWLYLLGIGKKVDLELQRDGQTERRSVVVEPRPESATTR